MHDYYLDQMGIERWVRRPLLSPDYSVVLLVICKANSPLFDGKSQILFNHILACIGLDISQVHVTTEPLWKMEFERRNPRALWVMTDSGLEQEVTALNKPMILSKNPYDLLLNPIDKKQVYPQLLQLLQLL
jgi:hypothetical protein